MKRVRIETQPVLKSQPIPKPYFPPKNQTGATASIKEKNSPRRSTVCTKCGIRGHYKSECWRPMVICYACGEEGHMKPNCPTRQLAQAPPTKGNIPYLGVSSLQQSGHEEGASSGKPGGKLVEKRKYETMSQADHHVSNIVTGKPNQHQSPYSFIMSCFFHHA